MHCCGQSVKKQMHGICSTFGGGGGVEELFHNFSLAISRKRQFRRSRQSGWRFPIKWLRGAPVNMVTILDLCREGLCAVEHATMFAHWYAVVFMLKECLLENMLTRAIQWLWTIFHGAFYSSTCWHPPSSSCANNSCCNVSEQHTDYVNAITNFEDSWDNIFLLI